MLDHVGPVPQDQGVPTLIPHVQQEVLHPKPPDEVMLRSMVEEQPQKSTSAAPEPRRSTSAAPEVYLASWEMFGVFWGLVSVLRWGKLHF